MNLKIARILSVLFHPLLLPTYLFVVLLYVLPESALTFPVDKRWILLAGIAVITFVLPALGTYALVRAGVVSSVELQDHRHRRLPLLFTAVCYSAATYLFRYQQNFGDLFYLVMLLTTFSVLVTYVISLFWKISAHSIGMGGALGILILLNFLMPDSAIRFLIPVFVLLSGAVMSARLALNQHDPVQVYSGFFTGLLISSSMLVVLLLRA